MKKGLVIIVAVALLGVLAFYKDRRPADTLLPPVNSSQTSASTSSASAAGGYKDGTFTGNSAETPYGPVEVAAVISGGKITNINFIQMPQDEVRSREITSSAEPYLKQTAVTKQNAKDIDFVTGATSTSYGFQESLQAALDQAAL